LRKFDTDLKGFFPKAGKVQKVQVFSAPKWVPRLDLCTESGMRNGFVQESNADQGYKLISLIKKGFFVAQLLFNVTNSQAGRSLSAYAHGFPTKLSTDSVGRSKPLYEQEARA
jgi:hypothetical protein